MRHFSKFVIMAFVAVFILSAVPQNAFAQKCRQFINYQTKVVDFRGLSVDIMGKATGRTDGVSVSSVQREASDEIQKLDLLQYNMCNQIKSVKSEYAREKLAYQQNNILQKMLKMQDGSSAQEVAPEEGKSSRMPVKTEESNPIMDIDFPCSGESFYSTDDLIRGTGIGWSMDVQVAKREARTIALEELSSKIEVTVKTLTENYSISTKKGMDESLERKLESNTKTIVNQTLSGWKTICEKVQFDREKNRYTCYMAIEISTKRVLEGVYSKLREDAELAKALPSSYDKFEKKFNEVMGDYEQSGEMVLDF